ncbi:MAG: Zn-ribbon domain-containing OB-fold protein [Candidatus Binatia bacterium]
MDETQYKAYRPHLPIPDGETEPYWEGARQERLRLKRCRPCDRTFFYPRSHCPRCWSTDTDWIEASGRGTIYSYTVIAHSDVAPFKDWIPYVVALVDLDEGPRMVTNVVGAAPEDLSVGRRVEVVFDRIDDRITLPRFRLIRESR